MQETKLIFLFFTWLTILQLVLSYPSIKTDCPNLYRKTFKGRGPKGNVSAGVYEEIPKVNELKPCVLKCCEKENCNVAFMSDDKCYHISCYSNELCIPSSNLNPEAINSVSMVLVKPTDDDTWQNVLAQHEYSKSQLDWEMYNLLSDRGRFDEESLGYGMVSCEVGIDSMCAQNEICAQQTERSRAGICQCKPGFLRNDVGDCYALPDLKSVTLHNLPDLLTEKIFEVTTNRSAPLTRQNLNVQAESKVVKLPDNEVTLDANVSPPEDPENKYQYEWTSLHQPEGGTAVKHQNGGQLHLEKLSEGTYEFKVSASTPTAYGETFVNVTVLPATRINTPPRIVITPANQTIKQPNTAAVLDASSSTDDDGILMWHWELQQGPLGYQPKLKDSPTLQLNDLTKPGNYTFKLTVTDSDKATSSSTANITVLAGTDYPPEANAGEDKIIYLPHNSIILNGSLSTDDHAITTWEWTKSSDDASKAVDMQDTRTPYLKLSNLEEGVYTFTLRVSDSANQSSTAQVHVFVKPPTNKPPVANAGHNMTISLPQTWVEVDASNSTDDNKIMLFQWEQVEGPSKVHFENVNSSKTNVTGLTKGKYMFKVNVTDDNKNVASDKVYVLVNQNKNQKPVANAGEDFEVELPVHALMINGSKSKDDWAIVKWKWTIDIHSWPLVNIVKPTDEQPVLIVTGLTVGRYIFNLTVYDEQGLSDSDIVTVQVKKDPKLLYLVEITDELTTQAQYEFLIENLSLMLKEGSKLQIRGIRPDQGLKSVVTFYVESSSGQPVPATEIVQHIRDKLKTLLPVTKVQTAICQNNCSGHGVCNELTRQCECEAFWMHNMFKAYLKTDEDSDCSWSVLYVVLGVTCVTSTFVAILWGMVYMCYTWCSRRNTVSKPANYKLISEADDLPPFSRGSKGNLSDSDTDSDVVFETRSKSSRYSDLRNGHKPSRNGFSKPGSRRVKT